jgi:hypothetical protein
MRDLGILIPIIAVAGGLSIPITAIIVDYKRRKLVAEERRAMIEKGMVPPPLEEKSVMKSAFDDGDDGKSTLTGNLKAGLVLLSVGLGLGAGLLVLQLLVPSLALPRFFAGLGTIGAAVTTFLGLGHLAYYAMARRATTGGDER